MRSVGLAHVRAAGHDRHPQRALSDLDARPDVRVIVLTGADPAFCAGLDLTELRQPDSPLGGAGRGPVIPDLASPLIGAINGVAVTGGLELALACDFLVASERAGFADTHVRVGIQPGWGLTVALPEAVGLRRAREMSATGNFIDTPTALAWGLVNPSCRTASCCRSRTGSPPTPLRPIRTPCTRSTAPTARARRERGGTRCGSRPRSAPAGMRTASTPARWPAARGRHRTRPRTALTRPNRRPQRA